MNLEKKHIRFTTKDNCIFDITCTYFKFCIISNLLSLWNGSFDTPVIVDFSQFDYINIIDRDDAGIKYVCYNNIRTAFTDHNITWED